MTEKKALVGIHILFKRFISVYFDAFFVLYFFKVANYNIIPIVEYYIYQYLFLFIGFFVIKNMMKKNVKVPFLRIGISSQALYISMIMLLKDNIINYIFLVGALRGISNGLYYYPQSLLNSEKIKNEERTKLDGLVYAITNLASIIIPIILGFLLTYLSYIEVGKIIFLFFIIMFILSFKIKDKSYTTKKLNLKGFINLVKKSKNVKKALIMPFLSGLTFFSGAYYLLITLNKVINFDTNFKLGIVEGICAFISLLISVLYSVKLTNSKKSFWLKISGIATFISLVIYAINPTLTTFSLVLIINSSFVWLFNLVEITIGVDITNQKEIQSAFKEEYLLGRELALTTSRCLGFIIVLIVSITLGSEYLKHLMVISGIIMLIESFITSKYIKENS